MMRVRCNNANHRSYSNYGQRGIKVCSRWDDYAAFVEDMGPSYPGPGYTLDRKDPDKGYDKGNCRWATSKEQQRHRRLTRTSGKLSDAIVVAIRVEYASGRTQPDIARRYGITPSMVSKLVNHRSYI